MSKELVDFTELSPNGELWEMFARDFLQELGFYIESQPNRGADGGKDMLVEEQLKGTLSNYRFRWLVSCKHYASSNKSVSENEEINIRERMASFQADGFLGFYSTIPSSGLNSRLDTLKTNGHIKDYRIFDRRLIENYIIRIGYSSLLMRYFPESYKRVKPRHLIVDEYIPILCSECQKDLLESMSIDSKEAIIGFVCDYNNSKKVIDIYFACKGECDRKLETQYYKKYGALTAWKDISDLMIPFLYMVVCQVLCKLSEALAALGGMEMLRSLRLRITA
jgi:hypothetical protein